MLETEHKIIIGNSERMPEIKELMHENLFKVWKEVEGSNYE
jgi:hypothetical protein